MADGETFYCWVRILGAGQEVKRTHWKSCAGDINVRYGNRPPQAVAAFDQKLAGLQGCWFADSDFPGDPRADTVFDYGPAYTDRDGALTWIEGEGQAWAKEAQNHFLFCLRVGEVTPASSEPRAGADANSR